jgi:hypothetical protein
MNWCWPSANLAADGDLFAAWTTSKTDQAHTRLMPLFVQSAHD